jgi:hypothetical protein
MLFSVKWDLYVVGPAALLSLLRPDRLLLTALLDLETIAAEALHD